MTIDSVSCWAVVPAAGIGARMGGGMPKQYLPLHGATVLEHSLAPLLDCARLSGVIVAVNPRDEQLTHLACFEEPRVKLVTGGAQRCDSVLAALDALLDMAAADDWVLVHDAARPCLSAVDLDKLIVRVTGTGVGGILAEAVNDTVKQVNERQQVLRTLDRKTLWRAQTPQMFRLDLLHAALLQARAIGAVVTDESAAMELAGHPVQVVASSSRNPKVTVPADLSLAAWCLANGDTDKRT